MRRDVASHPGTLYRWWPDKAALVADALAEHLATGPVPDTGSTRDDLIAWLRVTIPNYTATPAGVAMPALISDLASRPGGLAAFRESFLDQRRAGCAALIRRGITRGDLPPDTDVELLMDALAGTVFYRQLASGQPITSDLAERIVTLLGLSRRSGKRQHRAVAGRRVRGNHRARSDCLVESRREGQARG